MNFSSLSKALLIGAAGLLLSHPTGAVARTVRVSRDFDHDGHFNTKSYHVPNHPGVYNHGYRYGYGYRSYGYPYRAYPYYGYPYRPYLFGPSVGVSYYGAPYYGRTVQSGDFAGDIAVEVQRELKRKGYYAGPVDGVIGSGSRAAIVRYQNAHRLPATGRVDSALLRSLGLS